MSAKSSIQVCIKVRPLESGESACWQVKDEHVIQLIDSQSDPYIVDYAFDQNANNQKVFDRMAKHIVHACMQGFNGTIFAYGQTSSGKTYTMMGDNNNPGVMVLAVKEIFSQIANNNDRDYLLRVGYIEIYNEKIYDLLNKKNQDLKIHETGYGIVNVNCEEVIITSEDDLLKTLCLGSKERTVGETNMNERSSRSHAIFRIIIESRKTDRSEDDAVSQSVLNLVDLAGSERADQTGARGARLKEGAHINKSLLFLSNVINSLAENEDKKYISFRDSKLTRILQASLVGNALTSIICTIKPSVYDESLSTLNFAMRAKKVHIKPQVNEVVSDATMMKRLEREIKDLRNRLAEEERKNESQLKVKQLEQRIKSDMLKIITSNSVNNEKRFQKRRRTWAPTATLPETPSTSAGAPLEGSQLKVSQLPKPSFFPTSHLTYRPDNAPKTLNILRSALSDDKEVFVPAENYDFGLRSLDIPTPQVQDLSRPIVQLALTPVASQMGNAHKEKLEFMEHQTFTNLEKLCDNSSEWVKCQDLTEKLATLTVQRDDLKAESLKYKQRCEALEDEVAVLSLNNQTTNAKIEDYEEQLQKLKQKLEKLEMENRELVGLEFEYKNHRNKSQLRENDLLSALGEKETKIDTLQKTLNELSRDMLRNSKEDQMRSMCPELESNCERICNNCQQLELLLNECKSDAQTVESINCECEKLRLEIVETRAKLECVQKAFGEATSEVTQKANDCERLSREAAFAREDMTLLQGKYDELEQSWQSQIKAVQDLQADYDVIQQKYTELEQSYENLGLKSTASAKNCLELQAENIRLQTEIGFLKGRVEEAQQKLIDATSSETLEVQFKAEREELQAKLLEMERNFNEIQREYDCLSNELMESVQEGDALRKQYHVLQEELKQHQRQLHGGDAESMKSSGVGTECSETEAELDNDLLQQFAKLSESLHEIELQHLSGYSRVFRAAKIEVESSNVPPLKLCLECTEDTDLITHEFENHMDVGKCVYLKGVLKQHRFKIIKLNNEGSESDCDLRHHIIQLENEIAEKNALIDATERTINEMREQMTTLESALLEKSVIVNKVEDYQRQIESLEKQNAEITMVCEELQEKVKENSLSDSFAVSSIVNDSNSVQLEQDLSKIVSLNSTISNLRVKETELQDQLQKHRQQLELKDETIRQLQTDIQDFNKRCLSMDVLQVELQSSVDQKQQLLERQVAKSMEDAQRIDHLQQLNADLTERSVKAEKTLNEMKERLQNAEVNKDNYIPRTVHDEQLTNMEKTKTDEINALTLEFLDKIETSESQYRANMRKYNIEWEESKDRYETNLAKLKESLAAAEIKLECIIEQHQSDLKTLKDEQKLVLDNVVKEKHEIESLYDGNQKIIESLNIQLGSLSQEQVDVGKHLEQIASLKKTIQDFEKKDAKQLLLYEQLNTEYHSSLDKLRMEKIALQSQLTELNVENQGLKDLVAQKSESLKDLEKQLEASNREKKNSWEKSQQLEEELDAVLKQKTQINEQNEALNDKLKDLKEELCQAKQMEQVEQLLKASIKEKEDKFQHLEQQLEAVVRQSAQEKTEMEEQNEILNAKLKDLREELQQAKQKDLELSKQDELLNAKLNDLKDELRQAKQKELELKKQDEILSAQLKELKDELRQAKQNELVEQQLAASVREKEEVLKKSQQLEEQLETAVQQGSQEKKEMEEKIATFNSKLKDLEDKLCEANQKVLAFDNLLAEHEKLKLRATNLDESMRRLEDKSESLTKDLKQAQLNVHELRSQLQCAEDAKKAASAGQIQLCKQLEELETRMSSESRQLQRQVAELQGSIDEQLIKLSSLHSQKVKLESNNKELTMLLERERKDSSSLREDCDKLKAVNDQLDCKLKTANDTVTDLKNRLSSKTSEINGKCIELSKELLLGHTKIEKLTHECEKLRSTLKAKDSNLKTEHQQKDATISSLLSDKRNLEEKLCTLNEIVAKLESQKLKSNSSNVSMDSNISNSSPSSVNPILSSGRRSLDRIPTTAPRKSISFESETMRKNRRIIAHDERRQSYWNDFRDAQCMTDPIAETCNCTELDQKLKDCQRELFIRDSQVTALNIQLKNHPLKIENAQLKQRLQDDVERARNEVKRFKQKNQDLMSKISALSDSSSKAVTSENVATTSKLEIACKETQTESELEAILEKTKIKLNDALGLCRFRYKQITDLQEKLKQNENNDTSNISSHTAGHIGTLKAKCEKQKKEIDTLHEKYALAKRALQMRKDEVNELREQIARLE